MRCKRGHVWMDYLPQHARIKVWVAHVGGLRCPKCGRGPRGIFMTRENNPAEPET
jgi:hypothetical protein